MRHYRPLLPEEIERLRRQLCFADSWEHIEVAEGFDARYVHMVRFSGKIRLGRFQREFRLPGGVLKHSGIYSATLHNVSVGDDCCIENVNNYIANYDIGDGCFIENVDLILTDGSSSFGNGVAVSVLNETGGREVRIHDKLSAQQAYLLAMYRHRPLLIRQLEAAIDRYIQRKTSERGQIAREVVITDSGTLHNVYVGEHAQIVGVERLKNGSINSVASAPVRLGYGVECIDFIISSGSSVEDGATLLRCFVGQACHLGRTYSASDSLFFGNCHGENGEACSIFAGPFTVTHHKSTLLIAGQFSFMNAGSGSNQSNHMYKLGPIHQGIMERGAKTTSDSYILWPARIGAFSLVMGRHTAHPDTTDLPFSYLIEKKNTTYLIPGVNLKSVGTIRDAQKWPKRDSRHAEGRLDEINYNLLSPYTIQKMLNGRTILEELKRVAGETSEIYSYQSAKIKNSSLNKGLRYYELVINKFLGNSLIKQLEGASLHSPVSLIEALKPTTGRGLGDWIDLSGLIAPKEEVWLLIEDIEAGRILEVEEVHARFAELHRDYYRLEWIWAYDKIETFYGVSLAEITPEDVARLVRRWHQSVLLLDDLIYEDAKKEFSLTSMTGFGADGDRREQAADFEQVRGDFENNATVRAILGHKRAKIALGNELLERLSLLLSEPVEALKEQITLPKGLI